jgi:PAS domain S-box-containing protein
MFMQRFIALAGLAGNDEPQSAPAVSKVEGRPAQPTPGGPRDSEPGPKAEKSPGLTEERLRAILDASPDAVLVVGRDGAIAEANPAGLELFEAGTTLEMAGTPLVDFVCAEQREAFGVCLEGLWRGEKSYAEFESLGRHGRRRWVEMHAAPLRGAAGEVISFLGILRDNTARRELDKQFIQAQKMEVVGHLASGVAHDFNNILGIVMGYTEILMSNMDPCSVQHEQAQTVFHTAERAAALTRQLLIFSSAQTPRPEVLDLSEVITNLDRMLRRLIGENINLVTVPEPELGRIEADTTQIEQVLMNLTINARDAMGGGGTITIETGNETVPEGSVSGTTGTDLPPGGYVYFSVKDTGAGIADEVKSRIFEAFFTTKPAGQGTGLGLATCQSIVRHWRGAITVDSTLGVGSIFKVYFPRMASSAKLEKLIERTGPAPRGSETVLLVEDEPGLLELTAIVLQRQGYTVLKASNGREALGMVQERNAGEIGLVVTDMVMPEMGGRMMADWLYAMNPGIKVLFTSGYTDCGHGGAIARDMDFIHKPYTPSALLRKMREVMDRGAIAPGAQTNPGVAA